MKLILWSWRAMIARAAAFPWWAALLAAVIVVPFWLVTLGLAGLIYEMIARVDDARVRRSATATPAPSRVRGAGAAIGWVLAIALIGSASPPTEDALAAAAPTPMPTSVAVLPSSDPAPTTEAPSSPIAEATTARTAAAFSPDGTTEEAQVLRIIDGDTIEVDIDGAAYTVRYIGIDTPETKAPGSPVEWMGPEATEANAALVEGATVILEKDLSEVDRYGRLLRYAWLVDGQTWTMVNLELVRLGFASQSTYPPDVKYAELLLEAEQSARTDNLGLWGAAPAASPTPTAIAEVESPEPEEEAEPAPLGVKLVSLTKSVRRGATASITIKTAARADCSISVEYKSGPSEAQGLGDKTAGSNGRVSWTWIVGTRTTTGRWPIYVDCSKGDRYGDLSARFQVK